jgi:hypothetical protein
MEDLSDGSGAMPCTLRERGERRIIGAQPDP